MIYEIITQHKPWDEEIKKHGIETVIKAVKMGTRPSIPPKILMEAPHELGDIMNECWRQHGVNRPSAKVVCKNLISLFGTIIEDGDSTSKSDDAETSFKI